MENPGGLGLGIHRTVLINVCVVVSISSIAASPSLQSIKE